ncbi:unnamed protein product [Brachionus calyciflorus]|uniref:Cyclin N-terminal domain-containing protein n=1 Tax=Brachionus calyciflorus TaxID=104777 RepID=A0A813P730_9BILA|nr:unnamed protein product [Brachionus calyciflorus]
MEDEKWPQFNLKPHCFGTDMLQEFLFNLAEKNRNFVENSNPLSGLFKRNDVAFLILDLSEKHGLNTEGKFLAIELFDRFMSVHLKEIHDAIEKNSQKDWTSTIKKIQNQMILRSFSCIQIANKLCSNQKSIKLTTIQDYLSKMNYKYSLESILSSELRVLKFLDYKLNTTTPYTVIEILLEILGHNVENAEPKALYIIAVQILECFYMARDDIYNRLYESFTGRTKEKYDRESFLSVESDYLYLGSSIIAASSKILSQKEIEYYETILEAISNISQMEKDDIEDFAVIICHFAILDDPI